MKGQPQGLIAAALANMGERFGFYIMMAILTLFISAKFGLRRQVHGETHPIRTASIYLSCRRYHRRQDQELQGHHHVGSGGDVAGLPADRH